MIGQPITPAEQAHSRYLKLMERTSAFGGETTALLRKLDDARKQLLSNRKAELAALMAEKHQAYLAWHEALAQVPAVPVEPASAPEQKPEPVAQPESPANDRPRHKRR